VKLFAPMPFTDRLLSASGAVFAFAAIGAVVLMAMAPPPGQAAASVPAAAPAPVVASTPGVKVLVRAAPSRAKAFGSARAEPSRPRLQCAIYARQRSGLQLNGAARSWWAKAEGRYRRSHQPEAGAVIVMDGTRSGHVGVVARVLSERQILIDHSNWNGRGEVTTGALVEDVSEANDWSAVRVWHGPTDAMGTRAYPVLGFIHADPAEEVASAEAIVTTEEIATY
jgi:surface antigen